MITGFHMMKKDGEHTEAEKAVIVQTAQELSKMKTVFYSGHCTGIPAFELMKTVMRDKLRALHSGEEVFFGDEPKTYTFSAPICVDSESGGAYVVFPFDIRKEFGKGRVKVHALFDGIPYDGSIVNMGVKDENGNICYVIGVLKSIRTQLGKSPGDTVEVQIRERR